MGPKRKLFPQCRTLALLFLFHYKKAEASEKHLVKADQQRPVGPRRRRLTRLAERKEVESGVPEKDAYPSHSGFDMQQKLRRYCCCCCCRTTGV